MNRLLIIFVIFIIGGLLRVVNLSSVPAGFTWDEAALGYNAFSLSQTGKDEWGTVAPIIFRSFDDFKPGLYVYLAVPLVSAFGLNEFSTRLPSAILGSFSIVVIYLLVRTLSHNTKRRDLTALATAFLWAINPWMILFSRGAWEANVWIFLTLMGLTLWIKRRPYLGSVVFGLTVLNYQGAKLLTPLILFILILINFKRIQVKKIIISLSLVLIISLPIILNFSGSSGRLQVFSMFSYSRNSETIELIKKAHSGLIFPNLQYLLFHSETLNHLRGFAERYLNHLSTRFLFTEGDWSNQRHSTPFHGNYYLFEIITISIGVWVLTLSTKPKISLFITSLICVAVLPAALSRDIVSGLRSLPLAIPITIISGFGLAKLLEYKKLILPLVVIIVLSVVYFLDLFHVHSKYYNSSAWLTVMNPVFKNISQLQNEYDQVIVSDKLGQPYIFALFFNQIHLREFVGDKKFTPSPVGDVSRVDSFSKYIFRPVYWPADRGSYLTLFAATAEELPEKDILSTPNTIWYTDITSPDKQTVFRIVGRKNE